MTLALDVLSEELVRLDLLLHREILRLRARYQLSLDEFRGLYISDQHVDGLLQTAARGKVPTDDARTLTARAGLLLGEMAVRDMRSPASCPWVQFARRLDLSRSERDLLLLALAPELDAKYETLYAYLNNDVTRKLPSLELAARLFADTPDERLSLRRLMSPSHTLASLDALEFTPSTSETPRAQRGLRVAQPLIDWLLGFGYEDQRLNGICRAPKSAGSWQYAPASVADLMLSAVSESLTAGQDVPLLVLLASSASEAVGAGVNLFEKCDRDCIILDLDELAAAPAPVKLARATLLMSRVLDLGIVLTPMESLQTPQGVLSALASSALRELCTSGHHLVLAGAKNSAASGIVAERFRSIEIELPELDVRTRAKMWEDTLDCDTAGLAIEAVADRFALGADRIVRAAHLAHDRARLNGGTLGDADLFAAARAVSGQDQRAGIRRVTTTLDWQDLVLPSLSKSRLQDLLDTVVHRHQVLDQWGFNRRMNGARGVKALFAGASGTGKTMAASLIAQRLGFDLHRIEIAAVVSKYIGETEKNLDRAFNAALRANAILFIDEADALFGKRSEVKDAHDRYANLETAYLLQKMEDHDGVVILATNLRKNIDESFSRRMQFFIEFPVPDIANRERLWRGMFPPSAPVDEDVDFEFLSRQFELTGGSIRNIVLEAAFTAAAGGTVIDMRQLLRAVAQEYAKRGRVPSEAEFREFYPLLTQPDGASNVA